MISTLVGNVFPPLATLAVAPVLAHALGVAGRGEVAAATAPLVLLSAGATLGIPEALTFAVARRSAPSRRMVVSGLAIASGTGAIAGVAAVASSGWLSGGAAGLRQLIVLALCALLPSLWLGVVRGIAAGLGEWRMIAGERAAAAAGRVALVGGLALAGALTPWTATLALAAGPLLGFAAYARLPRAATSRRRGGEEPPAVPLVRYGVQVWVGALSGILLSRIDQLLMTPLSGAYQLGLYATAVAVSEIPLVVNNAVREVMFAEDAAAPDDERLAAAARLSFAVSLGVAVLVAATMPLWFTRLFGPGFEPATAVAALLLLGVVLGVPGSIAGSGLSARGRPGLRSLSLVVAAAVNVVLVVVLVPPLGAIGAACATVVGNVLAGSLNVVALHRRCGVAWTGFVGLRARDVALLRRVAGTVGLRLRAVRTAEGDDPSAAARS